MWEKIKVFFKRSLTILWARLITLAGAAFAIGLNLTADPNVNGAIQGLFKPEYLPYWLIGIGVITEIARRRTVGKATNADNQVTGDS